MKTCVHVLTQAFPLLPSSSYTLETPHKSFDASHENDIIMEGDDGTPIHGHVTQAPNQDIQLHTPSDQPVSSRLQGNGGRDYDHSQSFVPTDSEFDESFASEVIEVTQVCSCSLWHLLLDLCRSRCRIV